MEKIELIKQINLKEKNKKIQLLGITFSRAFCSLGIFLFHYFGHSNSNIKFLNKTANSTWGFMFSTTFFCISGTVLYYNYPYINSIKKFYYKRWKAIFPSYYISFTFFRLNRTFASHKIIFRRNWFKLVYTIIGLDGYLFYRIKTYYIVGEWFLGAIILIYILYPLILWVINKNIIFIYLILIIGYYFMLQTNFFIIMKDTNLITCLASFSFGIIIIRYNKIFLDEYITLFISLILLIFLNYVKVRCSIIIFQLQGFCLFITLTKVGGYIMSKGKMKIINLISKLSYFIFLYHHLLIFDVLGINNPKEWYLHIILSLVTFILIIICSLIHSMVVNSILNSEIFKKIDSLFIE